MLELLQYRGVRFGLGGLGQQQWTKLLFCPSLWHVTMTRGEEKERKKDGKEGNETGDEGKTTGWGHGLS